MTHVLLLTNKKHLGVFIVLLGALVFGLVHFSFIQPAQAAELLSRMDEMSRLQGTTYSSHDIGFTYSPTFDFDLTGSTDRITIDFHEGDGPGTFAGNVDNAGWVTTDFDFNDGTERVILNVTMGAAPAFDCTGTVGNNDVTVAVDTDDGFVMFEPCGTFTASAAGAAVNIEIGSAATNAGAGVNRIGNAGAATNRILNINIDDEGAINTHKGAIAITIVDDDSIDVTSTVNPDLVFDIDNPIADNCGADGAGPYGVSVGAVSLSSTKTSGSTDSVNLICLDLSTNATGGVKVTVTSKNGSMNSTSTPADTISSTTGALAGGTERYGLCVATTAAGLAKNVPFNGAPCAENNDVSSVGAVTTSPQAVLSAPGPVDLGTSKIIVGVSVAGSTEAHDDYSDSLTFIATGTF